MPKEPRAIQVIPRDTELDDKIDDLTAKLRTSRSGLASIALEYVVNAIEDGRAVLTNGELHIVKTDRPQAA